VRLFISLLDGVSKHPVTTQIQASFLTQRKETVQGFHHEAHDDFKTSILYIVKIFQNMHPVCNKAIK
jgi:hypothetical protein